MHKLWILGDMTMNGTMMHQPLTISSLIAHASRYHGGTEVVSVETTGGVTRSTWSDIEANSRKLASALEKLGVKVMNNMVIGKTFTVQELMDMFGICSGYWYPDLIRKVHVYVQVGAD